MFYSCLYTDRSYLLTTLVPYIKHIDLFRQHELEADGTKLYTRTSQLSFNSCFSSKCIRVSTLPKPVSIHLQAVNHAENSMLSYIQQGSLMKFNMNLNASAFLCPKLTTLVPNHAGNTIPT